MDPGAGLGTTNAAFNWAVTLGDVVRVVLLFYLMPLWAVLLARLVLREPLTRTTPRCACCWRWPAPPWCCWPAGRSWLGPLPLPRTPDWLGVLGGFCFALNNVMLRREAPAEEARALAMFGGGAGGRHAGPGDSHAAVAAAGAGARLDIGVSAAGAAVPGRQPGAAVRRGAPAANVTSVVMLTEILFASASALLLGGGRLGLCQLLAAGLILASRCCPRSGADAH